MLLSSADLFFKTNFFKKLFQEHYKSVKQFGSRSTDILSVMIWVQTVCKGYQQTTKFAASKKS